MNQATANLAGIDIAIIVAYFLLIFCIGFYFARRGRTSTDHFLPSRNGGWLPIAASLFAPNVSTEHSFAFSGSGASPGLAVGDFECWAFLILCMLGRVF